MVENAYDARPWLAQYDDAMPHDLDVSWNSMLEVIAHNAANHPDHRLIKYFDGVLTYRQFDELTDALACALAARGIAPTDRVAVMTQNNPQFMLAMAGIWKAGATMVSVNPMNREREVTYIANDSGAKAIICLEDIYRDVIEGIVDDTPFEVLITTSELAYQTRNDDRVFTGSAQETPDGTVNLEQIIAEHHAEKPPRHELTRDDIAILTYTSGTTGEPKGATNTHGNVLHNSEVYLRWIGLEGAVIFAVAPLFHITGTIGHATVAMYGPVTVALNHRFEPHAAVDLIAEHGCTFTVGSITVFIALMNTDGIDSSKLATLQKVYSGGAPIPAAVLNRFREFSGGRYIHNAYGLTESTSPTHLVPFGTDAPIDDESGAVSVGVPIPGTVVRVLDDAGDPVPVGQVGEFESAGPGIVPAYWGKPAETARSIPGGALRTGDVGFMNAEGWYFLVDRKKDMINASGYKVWPREVEDVLYTHPAVREAAVVGVADEYRGETVKAVISLNPTFESTPAEITAYCKERMAAYKYPRIVEIVAELPKNASGKILRRELRG
ncbi:class I adenylate-forming enzyme family protein [Cumulibacter soli]|uniref:class I adenylate-forming enzyme family protein n=1 Tax=Cumulibacter soli TaxID=2546344 RepID=UPI001067F1F9|nr:AMP-binding protein [Cumulibacter soli]